MSGDNLFGRKCKSHHHPVEDCVPSEGKCDHPGCRSHVTHPCEGCGRQWSKPKDQTLEKVSEAEKARLERVATVGELKNMIAVWQDNENSIGHATELGLESVLVGLATALKEKYTILKKEEPLTLEEIAII